MHLVGGNFVAAVLGVAAIALATCGLFLVFLDINRVGEPGPLRQRLSVTGRLLAATPIRGLGRVTLQAASRSWSRFVYIWFEQSERNVVVSGVFTVIVLLAIPLASMVNAARGGSPFVLIVVICCLIAVGLLAALGEMRRAEALTALLSPLLFATMFIFLPGYVFWSLTDRMRHMPIGHAALSSLLVAPILYVVCQSMVLGIAGTWGALVPSARATAFRRLVTAFAAALPFAYLLMFVAQMAGHLAMPDQPQPMEWPVLFVAILACALSAASTSYFLTARRTQAIRAVVKSSVAGLILCYLVAWLVGFQVRYDVITLSPLFWLVHLALLPPLGLIGLLVLAGMAKIVLGVTAAIMGAEAAAARPYFVVGTVMLVMAGGAGWAAAIL